jgi:hypothetical protein
MCKVERTGNSSVEAAVLKSMSQGNEEVAGDPVGVNNSLPPGRAVRSPRRIEDQPDSRYSEESKTIPKMELRDAGSAVKKVMLVK